jgi:hypothetical protein
MATVFRATLLGIIVALATAPELTGPHTVDAAESSASLPTGSAVLRTSSAAMQRSLHAVHTEGRVQLHLAHQSAQSRLSGDCISKPGYQATQFSNRGSGFVNGVLKMVDDRYRTVQRHTWRRSSITGNRWRRADSDQGALLALNLCPATLLMSMPGSAFIVSNARNLGAVTMHGRKIWHIQYRRSSFAMDFYVEQSTGNWIRLEGYQGGPPQQHETFDYSAFNETVTIQAPEVGAASP